MWRRLALIGMLGLLSVAGCSQIPSSAERRALADTLAAERGWHARTLTAGSFELVTYLPRRIEPGTTLTIYIEGDGGAWITPSQPALDPTPFDPVALRLALAQPHGQAVYLARACQFVAAQHSKCPRRYWTDARFAAEAVAATDAAIDLLRQQFGAQRLTLVGYSGGAAVAALVAARRTDVERLVTVAGNLDPHAWSALHGVAPLRGSLDPVDAIAALQRVKQWHFVGERDRVVPPLLVQGFAQRFSVGARPVVQMEPGFDHRCCWAEQWPRLWRVATGER